MKNLFFILLFLKITTVVNAQDTIIETKDYYLQINRVTEETPPYKYIKTGENFEVFEFQWTNGRVEDILKDWMTFMKLEEIEYRIDENISSPTKLIEQMNKKDLFMEWQEKKDSMDITKFIADKDIQKIFSGYHVIYQQNEPYQAQTKAITMTAFKAFCSVLNLEIDIVKEPITYYQLEILDTANATISYDQNTHWKRTDTEEYIYYERIKYRRIADLLSRKLDTFVRPIPYQAQKFDVRMPHSDDIFELKYAMIEHGLELTEVTEEIEVMVIKKKE